MSSCDFTCLCVTSVFLTWHFNTSFFTSRSLLIVSPPHCVVLQSSFTSISLCILTLPLKLSCDPSSLLLVFVMGPFLFVTWFVFSCLSLFIMIPLFHSSFDSWIFCTYDTTLPFIIWILNIHICHFHDSTLPFIIWLLDFLHFCHFHHGSTLPFIWIWNFLHFCHFHHDSCSLFEFSSLLSVFIMTPLFCSSFEFSSLMSVFMTPLFCSSFEFSSLMSVFIMTPLFCSSFEFSSLMSVFIMTPLFCSSFEFSSLSTVPLPFCSPYDSQRPSLRHQNSTFVWLIWCFTSVTSHNGFLFLFVAAAVHTRGLIREVLSVLVDLLLLFVGCLTSQRLLVETWSVSQLSWADIVMRSVCFWINTEILCGNHLRCCRKVLWVLLGVETAHQFTCDVRW